jgi:hypothetical protein
MLYAFMKMIDPGSAVREGEFANASNSGGIPDAIRIAYNRAIQGDKLSDDMRAKFRAEANNVYAKRLEAYKATAESYGRLATEQGADPARVVVDLGYAAAPVTNPGAGLTTLRPK